MTHELYSSNDMIGKVVRLEYEPHMIGDGVSYLNAGDLILDLLVYESDDVEVVKDEDTVANNSGAINDISAESAID